MLTDLAADGTVRDVDVGVAGRTEGFSGGVVDGEGNVFAAYVIANVVAIAW